MTPLRTDARVTSLRPVDRVPVRDRAADPEGTQSFAFVPALVSAQAPAAGFIPETDLAARIGGAMQDAETT